MVKKRTAIFISIIIFIVTAISVFLVDNFLAISLGSSVLLNKTEYDSLKEIESEFGK